MGSGNGGNTGANEINVICKGASCLKVKRKEDAAGTKKAVEKEVTFKGGLKKVESEEEMGSESEGESSDDSTANLVESMEHKELVLACKKHSIKTGKVKKVVYKADLIAALRKEK